MAAGMSSWASPAAFCSLPALSQLQFDFLTRDRGATVSLIIFALHAEISQDGVPRQPNGPQDGS